MISIRSSGVGGRFVRYADDIRVFVKSKRAAERVLEQSTRLLEQRLKLKVNVAKSVIAPAATAVLLGYGFYFTSSGVRLRIAPKAWFVGKGPNPCSHVPAVECVDGLPGAAAQPVRAPT